MTPPSCCATGECLPGQQVNCFQVPHFPQSVPWNKVDTDDVSCYECEQVCYCGTDLPCTCSM